MTPLDELFTQIQFMVHKLKEKSISLRIKKINFNPSHLETAFKLINITCKKYPCVECPPTKHRYCAIKLEERLHDRFLKIESKKQSYTALQLRPSTYYLESKKLWERCMLALSGGYGLPIKKGLYDNQLTKRKIKK